MAAIGNPLNAIFGLAGALFKPFGGSKPPAAAVPLPVPTVNQAQLLASQNDAMRLRRGAGANELTGGGAEAVTPGGKALLGQ